MIYKLLGAAIITLSCGGFGLSMALAHRKEVRALQSLINAINFMKCELEYHCIPLPELCRKTARISQSIIGKFFSELSNALESQICPDTKTCVKYALSKMNYQPRAVRNIILELSDTLGCFNLSGQLDGLVQAVRQAEKVLNELTFEQDVRLRRYQTLGLCAGAALAILLM